MKLFVYGTLRNNYVGMHATRLKDNAKYLGTDTIKGYALYVTNTNGKREGFPMVKVGNDNDTVTGDVYEFDEFSKEGSLLLATLNSYEGHPYLFRETYDKDTGLTIYLYQGGVEGLHKIKEW